MSELRNHSEITEAKEKAKTYYWDFALSEGDTIKEKYQILFDHVRTFSIQSHPNNNACVVGALELSAIISVVDGIDWIPVYEAVEDITYVGELLKEWPGNAHSNFKLYRDDQLPVDELLVIKGDEVSLIKVCNFPFAEQSSLE